MVRALAPLAALALLAACDRGPPAPEAVETEIPEELRRAGSPPQPAAEAGLGTPMAERVATLGLLNKRNNLTQDIELKPGEARRVGDVIVRLSACERTAPWEMPAETGAFVQVFVRDRRQEDGEWNRIFSGWMFKRSPSLNVVEHPIYDVWVKDCAMSFPGEEGGSRPSGGDAAPARAAPAAAASPAATPTPEPTVQAPAEEADTTEE
jgi:hypothetical protein